MEALKIKQKQQKDDIVEPKCAFYAFTSPELITTKETEECWKPKRAGSLWFLGKKIASDRNLRGRSLDDIRFLCKCKACTKKQTCFSWAPWKLFLECVPVPVFALFGILCCF